jgi:hypothetical protein
MNTPQEQAEDIFNRTTQRFDSECMEKLPDYRAELFLIQKQEIPLSELIAVAQAAKQYAGLVSECCMTGDRTGEVCDLHCALEALRATGKVEL